MDGGSLGHAGNSTRGQAADAFLFELSALSRAVDAALRTRAGGAVLASAAALAFAAPVQAATFTVTKLADSADGVCDADCSLREAVAEANANNNGPGIVDVVTFESSVTGTIALNVSSYSHIFISEDLTITGPGSDVLTVDGGGAETGITEGGIFRIDNTNSITMSGLTLANGAAQYGGALKNADGDLTLKNVIIRDSSASGHGGGINFLGSHLTLIDCTLSDNSAHMGGGLFLDNAEAILTNTVVTENTASFAGGGAFFIGDGNARIVNSTISNNTATYVAGGLVLAADNNVIEGSTISGNEAIYANSSGEYGRGGGIFATESLTLTSSTVHGNTAAKYGGGLYVAGEVTIAHSTLSGNAVAAKGGGAYVKFGPATLEHSIVADNNAFGAPGLFVAGTASARYSLVEDPSGTGIGDTNGNILRTDPALGPLQDNGGPTFTQAIGPASPAYNSGDPYFTPPPYTDQRGAPRVFGGRTDMGAYEYLNAPSLNPVSSLEDPGDGFCSPHHCTLREAVQAANAIAGADTVLFDSTLSGTIALNGTQIQISDELTIAGPGADAVTVDAAGQSRVFYADTNVSLTRLSGLTLANGYTDTAGGALLAKYDLELDRVAIQYSRAVLRGGGFAAYGDLSLSNSTVSDNSTALDGAGFYVQGDADVTNSTIGINYAEDDGGGFFVGNHADLNHVTVTDNRAGGQGGGFFVNYGGADLTNSIVANNSAVTDDEFRVFLGGLSVNYSLVQGGSSPAVTGASNITGVSPQHGALQDNGGPTPTQDIPATSPAFNAGSATYDAALNYDQRGPGFARDLFGAPDMGAFEVQGPFAVSLSIAPDPAVLLEDGSNSASLSACLPGGVTVAGDVAVTLAVAGSATPGADHDLADNAIVTIPAGSNCGTLNLTAIDDSLDEPDETVLVSIGSIATPGYTMGTPSQVEAGIQDDDLPALSLSLGGSPFAEPGGLAHVTATLDQPGQQAVVVDFDFTGTAVLSTDYTATPDPLTIPAGATSGVLVLTGVDDAIAEGNEGLLVSIDSATGALVGTPAQVGAAVADDEVPNILVHPGAGLITTEAGGQANFTVVLSEQPTNAVSIGIGSSNPGEGSADKSNLTFTLANWDVPQSVTVTGQDDAVADGDVAFHAVTAPATSSDPAYNGLDAADVALTNQDDDVAGIGVSPTSGLVTGEAGGTAGFNVVLTSEPTAIVTMSISSDDPTEGTAAPTSLVFDNANWDIPQTVTVTGVDDTVDDGDVAFNIVTVPAASTDPDYHGVDAADVAVTNQDDDAPKLSLSLTGSPFAEDGGAAQVTASLDLVSHQNVTVTLGFGGTAGGTDFSAAPNPLTIPAGNSSGILTLTGLDDGLAEGDETVLVDVIGVTNATEDGVQQVTATIADDEVPNIIVNPTAFLTTTEAGGTAAFTVVLTSQPSADVSFDLASDDPGEGTSGVSVLTFTTADWDVVRTVTVTGQDDPLADGDVAFNIVTAPASSADPAYDGLDPADVALTNADDEAAGATPIPALSGIGLLLLPLLLPLAAWRYWRRFYRQAGFDWQTRSR